MSSQKWQCSPSHAKAQADRIDTWAFYQARNVRAEIAKSTVAQLKLQALATQQPKAIAEYGKEIVKFEAIAAKQEKEKTNYSSKP